jgi:hypothetical protein
MQTTSRIRAASFMTGGVELVDSALPADTVLPAIISLLSDVERKRRMNSIQDLNG